MTQNTQKKFGLFDIAKLAISKKGIAIAITVSVAFGGGYATHTALQEPAAEEEVTAPVSPKTEISTGNLIELGSGAGAVPGLSMVWEFEYQGTPYRCFRWHDPYDEQLGYSPQGSLSCSKL